MTTYTTPIFDRTVDDISARTAKAFFNLSDWMRVYGNAQIVNAIVSALNGHIAFDTVVEPTITTIPTVTELNTLLANIERLRVGSGLPPIEGITSIKHDWIEGSAADAPDYLDANDWEKVLDVIFHSVVLSTDYRVYCGVAGAGQPRLYQARWRVHGWVPDSVSPVRRARTGVATTNTGLTRNNSFRRYD